MYKKLSGTELEVLNHIFYSSLTFYRLPTTKDPKSNKKVICVKEGNDTEGLDVSIVDILRFEGYLCIDKKNNTNTFVVDVTEAGIALVKERTK